VSPAKTAGLIEMPFASRTRVSPRNRVLDGVPIASCEGAILVKEPARTCSTTLCRELCKTAEPIEMSFGFKAEDSGEPKEACIRWRVHWRNLANTTEQSVCDGDAAFLPNYFHHLFSDCNDRPTRSYCYFVTMGGAYDGGGAPLSLRDLLQWAISL